MQTYFGVPNRVEEGQTLLFGEKLKIPREFSSKTIKRGYERQTGNTILDEVMALTNGPVRGLEKVFAPDSPGMPASGKGENYVELRTRQSNGYRGARVWPERVPRELPVVTRRVRPPAFGAGSIGVHSKLWAA